MDKIIQLVMVIAVGVIVAGSLLFIFGDQSDVFTGVLDGMGKDAKCTYQKTQYNRTCGDMNWEEAPDGCEKPDTLPERCP